MDGYEAAPPWALAAVAHGMERLVARNDRVSGPAAAAAAEAAAAEAAAAGVRSRRGVAAFSAARAPSISVGRYLERIERYAECSAACFVVGYVYVDRMAHRHPDALVGSLNVHRLILTSVLIASKVLDDLHHSNAFYAKVGGVSNAELNSLEVELLFLLDFRLMVNARVFESYCVHLEKEMVLNGVGQHIERSILDPVDETEGSGHTAQRGIFSSPSSHLLDRL